MANGADYDLIPHSAAADLSFLLLTKGHFVGQ